jgi:L-rhamnose mutarotase
MMRAILKPALMLTGLLALGCAQNMQRYGSVIGVKAEALDKYKALHAAPWPEINAKIKACNIRNYSIYLTQFPDGNHYLFSYFEYTGDDFGADMQKMADDPKTKEWWSHTDPMQVPLSNRKEGQWWKTMEEVYHLD